MKKYIILIFICLIGVFGILFSFFYETPTLPEKTLQNDLLMRNNTWKTNFGDSIPYKKGDEVELIYIPKNEGKGVYEINMNKLKEKFDIQEIYSDDTKVDTNDISKISIHESFRIISKAKENGILKKEPANVEIRKIGDIKEEKKEREQQEKNDMQKIKDFLDKKQKKGNINSFNISLGTKNINGNINQLIEILGNDKKTVQYINIGGVSFTPIISEDKVYISVSKNTFASGEYFILVQGSDGKLDTLNEKMIVEYSSEKVNIAQITPYQIDNKIARNIVLQGNGFEKVISIQLSNNIILKTTAFHIINNQVMTVEIPANMESGLYYFNIMTVDGIYELSKKTFTISPN